jgi:2-oxoacid:acceptor oxidoreductase delta subunit (pyruvate/2-ketoisovalerate family)
MRAPADVCKVKGGSRVRALERPVAQSPLGFEEAEPSLSPDEAVAEAIRCTFASPCHYCDVCQLMCPDLAITRDRETSEILIDLDFCKGCGLCAHYCPRGAIEMVVDE